MDSVSFEVSEDGRLIEVDPAVAAQRWRAGDGAFWIDLRESSRAGAETLLDEIGVEGLLKTRVIGSGQGTSFVALRHAVFAEWPVFADEACSRRSQIAALCLPNLIVTLRSEPIEAPAETPGSLDLSEVGPPATSTVLCAMLLWHGARTTRAGRTLRERSLVIDERMDADFDGLLGEELKQRPVFVGVHVMGGPQIRPPCTRLWPSSSNPCFSFRATWCTMTACSPIWSSPAQPCPEL